MTKIIFILFSIFFILGCSSKQKNSFSIKPYSFKENSAINLSNHSSNIKLYYAKATAYRERGFPSDGEIIEFLIKNIAKETIKNGGKYFFIISPKEVSNYEGRIINTIESFKENFNFIRSTNKFTCPKKLQCSSFPIKIIFAMLDKKSMDYIVWDAKKILAN